MNNNNFLTDELARFWASIIERLEIDLCAMTLSLHLKLHTSDEPSRHKIVFEGVSAFYFVNGPGERRFKTDRWDLAELSEIYYAPENPDQIKHYPNKLGVPTYGSSPNFFLEIWSTVLFIEAKQVVIDGKRFQASVDN